MSGEGDKLVRGPAAWLGYAASILGSMSTEQRRALVAELVEVEPCVPRVVWSGFRVGDGPLHDEEEGTVMGGVCVEVFDEHGSWAFESTDDVVEYADNCVGGIDALVRWVTT